MTMNTTTRTSAMRRCGTSFVPPCAALLLGLLSACATSPVYQRPDVAVPGQWQSGATAPAGTSSQANWWAEFQNPALDRLIALAMESNHDLKAAGHRITQARALAQVAGAARWPAVAVNANTSRERAAGGTAGTTSSTSSSTSSSTTSTSSKANIDATVELDLWGKNRQQQEAALGRVQSSVFAQQGLRLMLQAEVAITYFQLLSAGDRVALLGDSLKNSEAVLHLLQTQHKAGAVSGLEVARQQGLVASLRAELSPLDQQRQQARTALAVLLGRSVQDLSPLNLETPPLGSIHLPTVAAGLPSTLLVRRPDIQQAEADLRAAHADLGAARAALFPSLQLSATGGVASTSLSALLRASNPALALAAGLTAPIFDAGRRQGQVSVAKARQDELLQTYQQSILLALRDVENSLTAVQALTEQQQHQQEVLTHATTAWRMSDVRFRNGAVDFGTVLDAQRTQLAARAAQEATALSRCAATVALYRALGGGTPTN
jgi:outer membrane protein, multidrug efflux system